MTLRKLRFGLNGLGKKIKFGLNGLGKKIYFGLNGLGKTYDRIWPRLMKKIEYPPSDV